MREQERARIVAPGSSEAVKSILTRLSEWYVKQCDGDWEHQSGIRIHTLDNPGWRITVDLGGTKLADGLYPEVNEGTGRNGQPDLPLWIACFVRDGKWNGAGDPSQLDRLLIEFLNWAESRGRRDSCGAGVS